MGMFSRVRQHLSGETDSLRCLRVEKERTRRERLAAKDRSIEATSEFTAAFIQMWKDAGVDSDIERELENLGRYGDRKKEAR